MTESLEYSLWSRLQGQSMPYCIPPAYRFFLSRESLIAIADHVIWLCLAKLNLRENQLIEKASELPPCDWLAHCYRVSGGGGARSRAKPLSTGWMSKREGREAVPPHAPQTPRASSQCSTTFSPWRCHNNALRIQRLTFGSLADTNHLNCGSNHCSTCWRVPVPTPGNPPHYPSLLPR